MLRGLLALWRDRAAVSLDGSLDVHGVERGYDLVHAGRVDLDRSVIACYAPLVIDLDQKPAAETTIINATFDRRVVLRGGSSA